MTHQSTGLTLGKFAPLHKGHQYVIETALSEVRHLIVIIYNCPETISIPLKVRADWIRKIYPQVEVIEAWDGPLDVGDTPEIKRKQEDFILGILKGRKITHFYSSEFYGEHMSKALNAVDRRVDDQRRQYPVSATRIREDYHQNRELVHPVVYRDLISNIVFLGAPSTGKTTLAGHLSRKFNTVWMPEYGREYWQKHQINRRLTKEQLVEIAEQHIKREEGLLLKANRYLFTDTNAITTYLFSLYYHKTADERVVRMAQQAQSRYHKVFVCDTDIPFDDTWDRSGSVNRAYFQEQTLNYLDNRNISYTLLKGDLSQRIQQVETCL